MQATAKDSGVGVLTPAPPSRPRFPADVTCRLAVMNHAAEQQSSRSMICLPMLYIIVCLGTVSTLWRNKPTYR
jgi:hypothetical protein